MRTTTRRMLGGVAVLAATALTGCKDTAAPVANDSLLANAAAVAADATLEDVTLTTSPFGFGGRTGPGLAGGMGTRTGRLGGGGGIGGPLSGTRDVTFYDTDGNTQTAYDSLSTASIHFVLDVSGDATRGGWSASIERTRDMTVSGLEGVETTRTFNGSGTETVGRSRTGADGNESTFEMSGTFTYQDVVVPVSGSKSRWPRSGTITRNMTVTVVNGPRGDRTKTVSVVVTFDGTSIAKAVVNGETIAIDLAARPGRFPFRGGFGR